jgi:excisionase family DNA binding protein
MSNTSKAIIDEYREALLEQYLSLPEGLRKQRFPTTERAAELTGISRRTIQFWIESDDIKAIFVGKSYRIEVDSLMTFLKSRVNGRNHL